MRTRTYMGLDIETAKAFPNGENWEDHRPLGVACAVTRMEGEERRWFGTGPEGEVAERMSRAEVSELVDYLRKKSDEGVTITTWNGLGFDWPVLAEESGRPGVCSDLAWRHVDMMYHVFAVRGFPLGLAAAAMGMLIGTKTDGITGAKAPEMWAEGQRDEVIEYCAQDAKLTLEVAETCEAKRTLNWIARSGRPNRVALPKGWATVREAYRFPMPDTEWMDNPTPRSAFDGWLTDAAPPEGTARREE